MAKGNPVIRFFNETLKRYVEKTLKGDFYKKKYMYITSDKGTALGRIYTYDLSNSKVRFIYDGFLDAPTATRHGFGRL